MFNHPLPAISAHPLEQKAAEQKAMAHKAEGENKSLTALETQFPRILSNIVGLWGFPDLNNYLETLTLDERGNRSGFPEDVWQELYLLACIHETIVPKIAVPNRYYITE